MRNRDQSSRRSAPRRALSALAALSTLTFAVRVEAVQTPAAPSVRTVIVTEFENRDRGPLRNMNLSRTITDAVAVELAQTQRFEVLKRQEVARAASELGYRPPFDKVELSKLAASLGASDIVTGEIVSVQVVQPKNKPRTVRVGVRVRVMDASRGDVINGAAVVGTYSLRDDAEADEQMAFEAATRAAYQAVRQIVNNTLPEGIILNTVGGGTSGLKVFINRGSRDGIRPGMEMAVYRGGERLGVIRIATVFSQYAEADPVASTLGYRPMDTVRAIFPMPELDMRP